MAWLRAFGERRVFDAGGFKGGEIVVGLAVLDRGHFDRSRDHRPRRDGSGHIQSAPLDGDGGFDGFARNGAAGGASLVFDGLGLNLVLGAGFLDHAAGGRGDAEIAGDSKVRGHEMRGLRIRGGVNSRNNLDLRDPAAMLNGGLGFPDEIATQPDPIKPQTGGDGIAVLQPGAHGVDSLVMRIAVIVERRGFEPEIDRGFPKGAHCMFAVGTMDNNGGPFDGVLVTRHAGMLLDPGKRREVGDRREEGGFDNGVHLTCTVRVTIG
jgi:hypothetical protein